MKKIIIVLSLITLLSACKDKKYQPKGLTKLTKEQLLEKATNKEYPDVTKVTYKTEMGVIIPLDSLRKNYDPDEWAADYYVDETNVIKELVLRKANEEDKAIRKKIQEAYNKQEPITVVDVDCDQLPQLLQKIYESDQGMRSGEQQLDQDVDRQNLVMVISIIEKCGMPTLAQVNQLQMTAIWLVFQHADNANRKKYLPLLEKAAANGDLQATNIAMMKDRILMMDGEPQLYGTQVTQKKGEFVLYDLANPETVNKRRAAIGFGPLEAYLQRWDIEFTVAQEE
ncbi:DUF6624 domain-containing protein [Aquimarina brevivitae]|uniref:Lipoprotein n=1 Tax=Aquimarina brevivitae TaxID=323412 RepID=A0A4Q7P109_9FLAO|nr:DUF6624 domain-containing protein [Aquimarina brevivitae]RZS93237.1 hypothetical protein EV197_1812 [Aquimarina brevivitae]